MTLVEILILAVVQGITEWLPISSFGHLVIVETYLGLELPLLFNVILHLGTLFIVVAVLWREIVRILRALVHRDFKADEGRLVLFIVVGSIPIALLGLLFRDIVASVSGNLFVVGLALLVTGSLLYASRRRNTDRDLGFLDSLWIGIAQGIAVTPGISRSGATIATGLLRKVKKASVFTYSFLLSIPAIIGATILEGILEADSLMLGEIDAFSLLLGAIVSMIVGYLALSFLRKIVMNDKLYLFAYYCWIVGILLVLTQLFW